MTPDSRDCGQEEGVRPLRIDQFRQGMWRGTATMRQSGHLWATLVSLASYLLAGDLVAQQPLPGSQLRMGQSGSNFNSPVVSQPAVQTVRSGVARQNRSATEPTYIAVIGAVKTPTVFESAEPAVPLKTLIERAGGETAESIGTVRIMERTQTRFMTTLQHHLDLAVTHGQVVFVVPRGGRPARVTDPRQPPPVRLVLISGLARGPLLFNIGNQSRTFGDLLLLLGQSPELIARQQVQATQPQGQWMERESLLVHNTVIDFTPEGVNTDGVRAAVDRGFRYELPVRLVSTATAVPEVRGPATVAPTGSVLSPPLPVVQPSPAGVRITPPARSELTPERSASGIERTGSSILFDEPMPFPARDPAKVDAKEQSTEPSPVIKSDGRAPLMLPKTWQNPLDEEAEGAEEDPARTIERTSADFSSGEGDIITVSAETEAPDSPQPTLDSPNPASPAHPVSSEAATTGLASSFPWPQSWLVLLATIGVAATSVVVSRIGSRETAPTVESPEPASASVTPESVSTSTSTPAPLPAPEDEQRFLQRLIMNKVPLIEEEATLPPVDRLHGLSIGGRRLIVHEAHEGIVGPHFKVRDPKSTCEVELRLRRLMRSDSTPSKPAAMLVTSSQVPGTRQSRVSPLERALRNVERGDT